MRTKAIIIKKQNTNEYDQLVICYTEEFGKLTAVARSVLKKDSIQAMHLDVLNMVNFELVNGRAIPIITSAQLENGYHHLKSNLASLALAYFFIEIIDKLVFDNEKDVVFWQFLADLIGDLDRKAATGGHELSSFFRNKQQEFLTVMGYTPNMSECSRCSCYVKGSYAAYSIELGGILCSDCFLSGCRGVFLRNSDANLAEIIFENIAGKKLESLSFIHSVVK